jgi:hypothetical protein
MCSFPNASDNPGDEGTQPTEAQVDSHFTASLGSNPSGDDAKGTRGVDIWMSYCAKVIPLSRHGAPASGMVRLGCTLKDCLLRFFAELLIIDLGLLAPQTGSKCCFDITESRTEPDSHRLSIFIRCKLCNIRVGLAVGRTRYH